MTPERAYYTVSLINLSSGFGILTKEVHHRTTLVGALAVPARPWAISGSATATNPRCIAMGFLWADVAAYHLCFSRTGGHTGSPAPIAIVLRFLVVFGTQGSADIDVGR